jgi:hypothetical protein
MKSCTIAGCHRRACLMVEERVSPWKWERRWRCGQDAEAGFEQGWARPLVGKSAAILAIEAAGRGETVPPVAPVVLVVEAAPVVERTPEPVVKRERKPRSSRAKVRPVEVAPPTPKPTPKVARMVRPVAVTPEPTPDTLAAKLPALRTQRRKHGCRWALFGSLSHRLLSRVALGELLGDAQEREVRCLTVSDEHRRPRSSVANAATMLRRWGLVTATGDLTDEGRAWLRQRAVEHEEERKIKRERETPAKLVRRDRAVILADLGAGVPVSVVARRYGRRESWLRRQLQRLDRPAYDATVKARIKAGRERAHAAGAARRAGRPVPEPNPPGRRRREDADYAAGLVVVRDGGSLRQAARAAGLSVTAMRGRLRTDGLWPAALGEVAK